jgi:hypothetical protein
VNTPGCMSPSCTGEWSRDFISDNLTKVFASTKLKQHKADMLYQEQLTWMSDTQTEVEEERRQNKIRIEIENTNTTKMELYNSIQKELDKLGKEKNDKLAEEDFLKYQFRILSTQKKYNKKDKVLVHSLQTQSNNIRCKMHTIREEINDLRIKYDEERAQFIAATIGHELKELENQIVTLRHELTTKTPTNINHKFVQKCADPECHGFLSSRWKCGLCDKWTCAECHELKEDEHNCDPNTVATVQLLSKDTKGCPKCQTMINKYEGCDQVWCTQCHTAFSWKTGDIETKIHNPHYYEWRRQNGGLAREPGDNVCGNELNHELPNIIRNALVSKHSQSVSEIYTICTYISEVVRNSLHLHYVIIPMTRQGNNQTFAERTNHLRKAYLKKIYTLEEFKRKVEQLDRKLSFATETEQVMTLLLDATKEILFRFKASAESETCDPKIIEEIGELVKYANRCFMRIGVTYTTSSVFQFSKSISSYRVVPSRNDLK